jgi:hypothetical protein
VRFVPAQQCHQFRDNGLNSSDQLRMTGHTVNSFKVAEMVQKMRNADRCLCTDQLRETAFNVGVS